MILEREEWGKGEIGERKTFIVWGLNPQPFGVWDSALTEPPSLGFTTYFNTSAFSS